MGFSRIIFHPWFYPLSEDEDELVTVGTPNLGLSLAKRPKRSTNGSKTTNGQLSSSPGDASQDASTSSGRGSFIGGCNSHVLEYQ